MAAVLVVGTPAKAATSTHLWSMDEPGGSGTMLDSGSPTQTPGTWNDVTAGVPGFSGTAYRFNGSTSRVIVDDDASLDPGSSPFTVTAHVRFTAMPTSSIGGDYDVIRKGLGSTAGGYWKMEIHPSNDGTQALGFCQMKGTGGAGKVIGAPRSLNDGVWHTVSCTKNDSGITLTVDGTSYSRSATIGSIANAQPLTLGAKNIGGDWYKGDMDEVSLQISGGNTAPTASNVAVSTPKDTPTTITMKATDPETCELTFQVVQAPAHGTLGSITPAACKPGSPNSDTQTITYTPASGFTGQDAFTYTARDSGNLTSSPATVTIQVGAAPPPSSISEVQEKHAGASDIVISTTLNSAPKPGDVLVAVVVVPQASNPVFATPVGWTKPFTPARGAVFWKVADGTEQTISVNLAAGETAKVLRMWVIELAGVSTTNPFDQAGSGVFTSTLTSVTPTTAGATTQANEWAIAVAGDNGTNGGGESATNGFTLLGTGQSRDIGASKVLSATGTISTTISWTTARTGSWIIATFRGA